MRLGSALVVASIVGSGLAGGAQFVLSARPSGSYPDLIRLYKEDPTATLLLLEQATISCAPQLKKIRSRAVRGLLARTIIFSIETSSALGDNSTRESRKQRLWKITGPILHSASKTDAAILDDFLRQPDKLEVLLCTARTTVEASASRKDESKPILEGVEMRR